MEEVDLQSATVCEALDRIHILLFLCNVVDVLDEVKKKLDSIARDIRYTPGVLTKAKMLFFCVLYFSKKLCWLQYKIVGTRP